MSIIKTNESAWRDNQMLKRNVEEEGEMFWYEPTIALTPSQVHIHIRSVDDDSGG